MKRALLYNMAALKRIIVVQYLRGDFAASIEEVPSSSPFLSFLFLSFYLPTPITSFSFLSIDPWIINIYVNYLSGKQKRQVINYDF